MCTTALQAELDVYEQTARRYCRDEYGPARPAAACAEIKEKVEAARAELGKLASAQVGGWGWEHAMYSKLQQQKLFGTPHTLPQLNRHIQLQLCAEVLLPGWWLSWLVLLCLSRTYCA
jgi:hypothetical protein